MRSCEYLQTNKEEQSKRTKIVRLRNIVFKRQGTTIPQEEQISTQANMVAITFEFQKNDRRNKTVHMFKTGDSLMCPVIAWANTVKRILQTVPKANGDTTVCSYFEYGKTTQIDSNHVRMKIKSIVEIIGENELGFTKDDVGLHSIRSGGAMAMFLSGVSEIIIQRIGRWESFAFLDYIREQVESFTYGVSTKMLTNEKFYHINEKNLSRHNTEYSDRVEPTYGGDGGISWGVTHRTFSRGA